MVRIVVNRDLCVGAGLCAISAKTVFEQSEEDGLVVLMNETPSGAALAGAAEAARRCPSQAIKITENGTTIPSG